MKIEITQEDICRGVRGNSRLCPVARAVSRTFGTTARAYRMIFPDVSKVNEYCFTPPQVVKWIQTFDADHPVEPFSFEMPPFVQPFDPSTVVRKESNE